MRLERDHTPGRADQMRADEREVAPVGADVGDDHARTEEPQGELRLLRLVAPGEAHFARDRVVEIADEARAAEVRRQARQEGRAGEPGERVRQLIAAERQRPDRRRRERDPEGRGIYASLRATSTTLSDSAWGNICESVSG